MAELKPPAADAAGQIYSEKRRSQRVQLTIPIIVRGGQGSGKFQEETQTVAVSANGGLIRLKAPVSRGQEISIVNPKTAEELPCTVTFLGQKEGGKTEVGMEFSEASPLFWRVAFPPADWDPTERKLPTSHRPPVKAK
jgi:PilZ domain